MREGTEDWLFALPCNALGLHLGKQEFIMAAKYCLGLPVFWATGECPAQRCGPQPDDLGDCSCSSLHNHMPSNIFQVAQEASLAPVREVKGLLTGSEDRPAVLRGWLMGHIPAWTSLPPIHVNHL